MANALQEIADVLRQEFSDIPDVGNAARIVLRLGIAALLGGLLGLQRESHGKSAGIRTHMLVAMGAALFVLVPLQSGADAADVSRVVQGLVAGVGFLGAGTILKNAGTRDTPDNRVHGLTTAAGIWFTAAIGLAAGMGREATAVLSTLLALGVLALEPVFGAWMQKRRRPAAPDQPG
jgi:putative Mg2+ transporter-C (MgtC) family protein